MRVIQKITLIILIGIISCKGKNNNEAVSDNQSEPDINKVSLTDLKGNSINLKKYKGKTVFINFWATWCRPCLEEMPSIAKAMEILKDKNIEFLFASNETPDQIEKFKANHSYPFNYVRAENLEDLNIMSLPTTFIFNPEGKLVFSDMGYRKWDAQENIDLILNSTK